MNLLIMQFSLAVTKYRNACRLSVRRTCHITYVQW